MEKEIAQWCRDVIRKRKLARGDFGADLTTHTEGKNDEWQKFVKSFVIHTKLNASESNKNNPQYILTMPHASEYINALGHQQAQC